MAPAHRELITTVDLPGAGILQIRKRDSSLSRCTGQMQVVDMLRNRASWLVQLVLLTRPSNRADGMLLPEQGEEI